MVKTNRRVGYFNSIGKRMGQAACFQSGEEAKRFDHQNVKRGLTASQKSGVVAFSHSRTWAFGWGEAQMNEAGYKEYHLLS
jgi:hypothetical protein